MNPNHWLILAGSKPTWGHKPEIYSLRSDEQLAQEYEKHLMPALAITGNQTNTNTDELDTLHKENTELKERLLNLTKLLTQQAKGRA